MRGQDEQQLGVFSYVNSEQRIPHDHPLRQLRAMADEALRELKESQCGTPCKRGMSRQSRRERGSIAVEAISAIQSNFGAQGPSPVVPNAPRRRMPQQELAVTVRELSASFLDCR